MAFWNKKDEPDFSTTTQTQNKPVNNPPKVEYTPVVCEGSNQTKTSIVERPKETEQRPTLSREEQLNERFGKLRSALGSGTVIQGKLSFDTPVRIDGKLGGEVFSSKALIVGASGVIEAQIEAAVLVVMGTVRGNVKVTERVELLSGGQIVGDISTPILLVEEGAVLSGGCAMQSAVNMAAEAQDHKRRAESAPNFAARSEPKPREQPQHAPKSGIQAKELPKEQSSNVPVEELPLH